MRKNISSPKFARLRSQAVAEQLEGRRLLAASYAATNPTLAAYLETYAPDTSVNAYPLATAAGANVLHVAPASQVAAENATRQRGGLVNTTVATTMANALNRAQAGDVIVLRGGVYRDVGLLNNGLEVRGNNLTITAARGHLPVLNGGDVVTNWTAHGGGLWSTPFTRPASWVHTSEAGTNDYDAAHAGRFLESVFRDGTSLRQTEDDPRTAGVEGPATNAFGPDAFFVDTSSNRLFVQGDPAGRTMEVTARYRGLSISGRAEVAVRGLVFTGYAQMGTFFNGRDLLVEDNVFAWNGLRGTAINNAPGVTFRNNFVAANGQQGVSVSFIGGGSANRATVAGNTFLDNNNKGFRASWSASALKVIRSQRLDVIDNTVLDQWNNAQGLWFDISMRDSHLLGNYITKSRNNSWGVAMHLELSHDNIAAFNTVDTKGRGGVGLLLSDTSAAQVWHNTFAGAGVGVRVQDSDRVNGRDRDGGGLGTGLSNPADTDAGAWWVTRLNVVKNNIFHNLALHGIEVMNFTGTLQDPIDSTESSANPPSVNATSFQHTSARTAFHPEANSVDHNLYHGLNTASGSGPVRWVPNTNQPNNRPVWSVAQFRANTDLADHSVEQAASVPLFAGYGTTSGDRNDLTPVNNSVAVRGGAAMPANILAVARRLGIAVFDPNRPDIGVTQVPAPLPAGWVSQDIGSVIQSGGSGQRAAEWVTHAAGTAIGGNADAFHLTRRPLQGAGSVIARVDSFDAASPAARAGATIRGNLMPAAPFAAVLVSPTGGVAFHWRLGGGGNVATATDAAASAALLTSGPIYTRVTRDAAGVYTGFWRQGAGTWQQVGLPVTLSADANNHAGTAVTAGDAANLAVARFDFVAAGNAFDLEALPAGWQGGDVGVPGSPGESFEFDGTWTLRAGGGDISGTSDRFQFARATRSGDGDVEARVLSVENANTFAKSGVMFRASAAANAAYVLAHRLPDGRVALSGRSTAGGGSTTHVTLDPGTATPWLKIQRRGNAFTAQFSTDGRVWRNLGPTLTINMPATAVAGLAHAPQSPTLVSAATFDSVTVRDADLTAPSVEEVRLVGDFFHTRPASQTVGGYVLRDGQTPLLFHTGGVDTLRLTFDEQVRVLAGDLGLTFAGGTYGVRSLAYDSAARTATWRLDRPLSSGLHTLRLTGVTDDSGNALATLTRQFRIFVPLRIEATDFAAERDDAVLRDDHVAAVGLVDRQVAANPFSVVPLR